MLFDHLEAQSLALSASKPSLLHMSILNLVAQSLQDESREDSTASGTRGAERRQSPF
jgi:hypothetical protein